MQEQPSSAYYYPSLSHSNISLTNVLPFVGCCLLTPRYILEHTSVSRLVYSPPGTLDAHLRGACDAGGYSGCGGVEMGHW